MSQDSFSYTFTEDEVKALVLFIRKYEMELPSVLDKFMGKLENHVYKDMTIEQAEEFFL